jgi:hypothetical protein
VELLFQRIDTARIEEESVRLSLHTAEKEEPK